MDKRLVIAPWKVELVQRYFSAESAGTRVKVVKNMNLDGREKSNCPPPPQMSISKMTSQSGNQEDQGTSPLPRVQISYSRPKISKMKKPQGEGKNYVSSSHSNPVQVQCRPQINIEKRKFPIEKIVQDEKDQGRSCVCVVLKSSSTATTMKLSERIRVVEDLSSKYPVKYEGKTENSKQAEARLDFCFHSAKNARFFFGKVNDLVRSGKQKTEDLCHHVR